MMTGYFLPGRFIRTNMKRAVRRGVKIRLILAGISDVKIAKYAERYMYNWLFRNHIELYEYKPCVLHAKVAVADRQWSTIGSYNVNDISAFASMGNDQTFSAVSWSAGQYLKFEKERNRPIEDLLARTNPQKVQRVIDLGCGPGNSTEFLVAKYPDIEVNGIDSSPEMIAAAKERLPGVHFEIADISTWEKKGLFDIILANASLQWVPDHVRGQRRDATRPAARPV